MEYECTQIDGDINDSIIPDGYYGTGE